MLRNTKLLLVVLLATCVANSPAALASPETPEEPIEFAALDFSLSNGKPILSLNRQKNGSEAGLHAAGISKAQKYLQQLAKSKVEALAICCQLSKNKRKTLEVVASKDIENCCEQLKDWAQQFAKVDSSSPAQTIVAESALKQINTLLAAGIFDREDSHWTRKKNTELSKAEKDRLVYLQVKPFVDRVASMSVLSQRQQRQLCELLMELPAKELVTMGQYSKQIQTLDLSSLSLDESQLSSLKFSCRLIN